MGGGYLGMSGGVDWRCPRLLLEANTTSRAIYMPTGPRALPGFRSVLRAADDLADAERVCVTLGVNLDVWDCEAGIRPLLLITCLTPMSVIA